MKSFMEILWNAARLVSSGRLPHLWVLYNADFPYTCWYIRWVVPVHTIPEQVLWASEDDIPF
jgi:hypothetical protein